MPLFKKKDPKEQVSRPLDDLEVEAAVCDPYVSRYLLGSSSENGSHS